jgi:hypothetical protein
VNKVKKTYLRYLTISLIVSVGVYVVDYILDSVISLSNYRDIRNSVVSIDTYNILEFFYLFITFVTFLCFKQIVSKIKEIEVRFSLRLLIVVMILTIMISMIFIIVIVDFGFSIKSIFLIIIVIMLNVSFLLLSSIVFNWIMRDFASGAIGIFFDKNIAKIKSILVFIFTSISTFLKKTYDME